MEREIICAHVGQAGVQMSNTVWELFCTEHGIQSDGNLNPMVAEDNTSFQTFFQEIPTGQFVPRALSIDLEPTVLDEIRSGPYRKLFHPDQLISGFEDAANNFARGHFTLGKDKIDCAVNRVRRIVEMCNALQGFFLFHGFGGGTGSGFTSLLMERIGVEFTKKNVFQVGVFPGDKLSCAVVEPYNATIASALTIDTADITNVFDNESIYSICANKISVPRPTYSNLNRVIATLISSLTVSVRFEGYLNAELEHMITNLVPYPRIHFPVFTHAPLDSVSRASHQTMNVIELTRAAFDSSNQLISCNLAEGKYMACCLQYRGNVSPREVNDAIFEMKRRSDIKFVDWCPTGFKLGMNNQPPAYVPKSEIAPTDRSVTMLANTTAISQRFNMLRSAFDVLFKKRCFIHWYVGEGMEEAEFQNCADEMALIANDYEELVKTEEEIAEEQPAAPEPPPPAPAPAPAPAEGGEATDQPETEETDDLKKSSEEEEEAESAVEMDEESKEEEEDEEDGGGEEDKDDDESEPESESKNDDDDDD